MFQPIRLLTLALVAGTVLPACARLEGMPIVKTSSLKKPAINAQSGTVTVRFPGLQPAAKLYRTLAKRTDIESVELSLRDARGNSQQRRLERREMLVAKVDVAFKNVAVGPVEFAVTAYDGEGHAIGQGLQTERVLANKTTVVSMSVKLAPETVTGQVAALIDFVDGDPEQPCGLDAFYQADRDGDDQLSLKEYRAAYPFSGCNDTPVFTVPAAPPEAHVTVISSTDAAVIRKLSVSKPRPTSPVFDPIAAEFHGKDQDGNGWLSQAEFLGLVAPPPVDPCEQRFFDLDANQDGGLNFEEWRKDQPIPLIGAPANFKFRDPALETFRRLDQDGDGQLSLPEHCGLVRVVPMPAATSRPMPGIVSPIGQAR
ncbi:MAG: hypothetical protein VKP62_02105 [Candidatus Sericytochromatia bacterium]|nr:hypothetical protein [Candidatus Sericytochromatia bacterium]